MEDAARLALIERSVNNRKIYEKLLNEFLLLLNHILEDPHDDEFRRVVNDTLQDSCENYEDFCDYLKYLGFVWKDGEYVLPMEKKLESLKQAKTAVERKIKFCFGPQKHTSPNVRQQYKKKISLLKPVDVLSTDNSFLLSIQRLFNDVLKYEDVSLQEMARRLIPMTTLELRAVERMREFQKKIKTGEVKDYDLSYDMALLAELLSWFKHMFFSWVDKPPCPECGGATKLSRKRSMTVRGETCLVEGFDCTECRKGTVEFPRHNDPRNLLVTRRGRCGEFTNCFALMCRALGYDTRYVCDNADHVWCEVFDYDSYSWIHVDPSECKMNAPLMYAHGWNKQLSYVIAASRDDVQDVTWRYTSNFKEVLKRRRACSEQALVGALLALREARQRHVSAPRRRHLAIRTLRELVHLMQERRPEGNEWQGRLSGSLEWRRTRGELGTRRARHVFAFDKPGECSVRYCTALDRYLVTRDGVDVDKMASWSAGVFDCENVFRKVEADWEQVYLAREEGASKGMVSWKIAVADGHHQHLVFEHLSIDATVALYENGEIEWSVEFDDEQPVKVTVGERTCSLRRRYRTCVVRARLSGGRGEVGWQHAQVLRQPLHSTADAIHIRARLTRPPGAKV